MAEEQHAALDLSSERLLPEIKRKGAVTFNALPLNGTLRDLLIVFDRNDDKKDEWESDLILKSVFLDSEACRVCALSQESLNTALADFSKLIRARSNQYGKLTGARGSGVLFLIRGERLNSLKDELTRLVAAVSSSGFDCDVCILDDSGDIDRLFDASKKKENYVEGANHLWFTFADSTHISLLILLQLFDRNNHERNSVTIIDHCRSHNANEYAFARHAEQVLLRIRDQEYTGDVGAYCNRIIADCRSRFMSEYPTGLKCLPYYPSRGCSVGEYFGGERILLEPPPLTASPS